MCNSCSLTLQASTLSQALARYGSPSLRETQRIFDQARAASRHFSYLPRCGDRRSSALRTYHFCVSRNPSLYEQLERGLADAVIALTDGWKAAETGARLGVDPTRISKLRAGNLQHISVAILLEWIASLGYDVELRLTPRPRPVIERPIPQAIVTLQPGE